MAEVVRLRAALEERAIGDTEVRSDDERAWRALRGRHIGVVPQSAATSFTPVRTIGSQLAEVCDRLAADRAPKQLLTAVALPADVTRRYPHELSGGQRQGIAVARACAFGGRVVIMDEPQNMESLLSQSAVSELDPVFTLRYSATHKKLRNVVYRLDPVDAHDLGLVKQIVVADVQQQGADATPYIKLVEVKNDKGWVARLELSCRCGAGCRRAAPCRRSPPRPPGWCPR